MRITASICTAAAALLLAPTVLACELPTNIVVPDGKQATEEEMAKAGKEYHQFMIDMQRYQVCLENETNRERLSAADSSKNAVRLRENEYASLHNAASDLMTRTTQAFNLAIEDYEARQ